MGEDCLTSVMHQTVLMARDDLSWAELREEGRSSWLQRERGTEKWRAAIKHKNWKGELQRWTAVSDLVEKGEKILPQARVALEEGLYSKTYTEALLAQLKNSYYV